MDTLAIQGLGFLAAAVVAAVAMRRLGGSSAVGYLVAGLAIGPSGLGLFADPEAVLGLAGFGIVLFLFVIGLDTRFSELRALRGDILGIGLAQVVVTAAALALLLAASGLAPGTAALAGFALALSGTAIALQILDEQGAASRPHGRRAFAILLTQDVVTIPVLALLPLLLATSDGEPLAAGLAVLVIAGIVLTGRYLLDHLLRAVAGAGAREAMTAAALLVVLAAAMAARAAGLSMALGAFLAGLMLAGSRYRHQLRGDIEPFRGLLLALFFMGIGMLIDARAVWADAGAILALLAAVTALKVAAIAGLARVFGSPPGDALRLGLLLAAAGEFTFVVLPLVATLDPVAAARLTAVAALSMVLAPVLAALAETRLARPRRAHDAIAPGDGTVFVLGFGRFGQVAAQLLLAEGVRTTLIDPDPFRVDAARRFGFKVFYGDPCNLEVLAAAGLPSARLVLVCIDDPNTSLFAVRAIRAAHPRVRIHASAFDRTHAIALLEAGALHVLRETVESAMLFGRAALEAIGVPEARAAEVEEDVRRRDAARLALQRAQGIEAGLDLLHQRTMRPEPLVPPRRQDED